jgi:hypothetical protein
MGTPAILINKNTGEIIKDAEYPRKDLNPVVGLDANLQWLIKVFNDQPTVTDLQKANYEWVKDLANSQYVQTWTIENKTEAELIAEKESQAQMAESELNTEQVKKLLRLTAETLTEEQQVEVVSIFPAWKPNISVLLNEKYQYGGLLYKVVQSHNTQLDWTPDIVPALFTRVAPPEVIPVFVHPTGAHDVYNTGDKVHFPTITDPVYESLIDNNAYSPEEYPQGWRVV